MQQSTVTLIVAVVGIAGTFGSGYFSQRMARQSQHEQWLRDKRTEDCQMLVTSLAKSYLGLITHWREGLPQSPETQLELTTNATEFSVLYQDRLFILDPLRKAQLGTKWHDATQEYKATFNLSSCPRFIVHGSGTDY
jgi:hypothetical protein